MAKKDEAAAVADTDPPDFGSVDDEAVVNDAAVTTADVPAAADEGKAADAAALATAAAEEPRVPLARFNRVNDSLAETKAENERLKGELAGVRSVAQPKAAAAEAAKPVDIRALLKASKDAMLEGDAEKATELEMQVEDERERRRTSGEAAAKAAALEEFRAEQANMEIAEVQATAIAAYPFLDHRAATHDAGAIAQVNALYHHNLSQRMRPGPALQAAVAKVVPLYVTAVAGATATDDLSKKRQEEALKRAGAASLAQPQPLAGGVGARSGASALTAKNMSAEQIKAIGQDKKGLEKMFAGDLGG